MNNKTLGECVYCGKSLFSESVHTCTPQAKQGLDAPVWPIEDCVRVLKTLNYIEGIAAKGEGRQMRDDESLEQFILGYVKRLETQTKQGHGEPVALDVTLEGDEAILLYDQLGDDREDLSPVRLVVGDGHSGYGLYVAQADYQDEGAVLLTAITPPTPQPAQKQLSDKEVKAITYVGPVYAPDGIVTRTAQNYLQEIQGHRLDAIRRTEAAHGIKGVA